SLFSYPSPSHLSTLSLHDALPISLYEAAIVSRFIAGHIRFWPWPILLIPFAEALREPDPLVEILCAFLQISPGETERKQAANFRSEEHTSELQSRFDLVCRLLLEK